MRGSTRSTGARSPSATTPSPSSHARLALLTGALCLAAAAPAAASRDQESIFEDEHQLLERGPAAASAGLDDVARLGADSVRSLVLWSRLAPGGAGRPRGFSGAEPKAYPPALWDPYDDLVRGTSVRGLGLILSPSTPMPAWASRCKRGRKATCKPDPQAYRAFVTALGRRYSGSYADENQGGGMLPRVSRWSLGNEPNQPAWLTPQYERRRGRLVATAAVLYRRLAVAGIAALRASGHGRDQILLGETSPIGRAYGSPARRPIAPVEFLRKLFCLTPGGRRLRGAEARRHACGRPRRLAVAGYAHHPYLRGGSRPPTARPEGAGEITIATAARLRRVLDQAARARRIPRRLPVFYTEFGFQTNPPDGLLGVRVGRQPGYINQSDWIAYRDPRVRAVAQYKLVDEAARSSFQSGLRFLGGRAKPAYDAYRLPIWVSGRGPRLRVYGQVRPAPNGSRQVVRIQLRRPRARTFATVRTVTVRSRRGHFVARVRARPGVWRLAWGALRSREARAARR
ncbi:MAG TPA: hypothetical protein VEX67_08645 [Solirubrobacteraceae bacterium]|nr:hypothetical protein [Solirubrobacteraceae bacterium]